jgi:hypothetical protein
VVIQVVPFRAGPAQAMGSVFTVLSFPCGHHVVFAHVENFMRGQYVEHLRDREL